jgi:serine/threonine-protein kinase HipA
MSTVAAVNLWGRRIGAVSIQDGHRDAVFQYTPEFVRSAIQVSPITMPLRPQPYVFAGLSPDSFHGLPGLLADSLPDRFGNALIDAWLASLGRRPEDFNVVERLCYIATRGMGALEFWPARGPGPVAGKDIRIEALVELASEVLADRQGFATSLAQGDHEAALREILSVGTSAGGARAKAVIAWNPATNAVRSGQVEAGPGFEHWLLKFDGVSANRDKELNDPEGYGAIEYAYAKMARRAGVEMTECRLLEEHGRRHFMTRRFDRLDRAGKLHMQSLAALAHFDFNDAGAHSYEQAFAVIRRLRLGIESVEQMFRRMAFNVIARNQDDHVKNIAFLMDRSGRWSLAPAFDVTYAYTPTGAWTNQHQMSVNGKRDDFVSEDFDACARPAAMKRGRAATILQEVGAAVGEWPRFAAEAEVQESFVGRIGRAHRLMLGGS